MKTWFLQDFNGFIDYRAEWTEDPKDAMKFSRSEIDDDDDLDVSLARGLGQFVPLSAAMDLPPMATLSTGKMTNHALEADVAWTLHRLQKQYAPLRWSDARTATRYANHGLRHAAAAGRQSYLDGDRGFVSGHIKEFPELRNSFNMGFLLQRHFSEQGQTLETDAHHHAGHATAI